MLSQEQRPRLWTTAFITLTVCSFLVFFNLQLLLSPLTAYTKSTFMASDVSVSLVTSVFAVSAILTRFMTAFVMKRMPRSAILYTGIVLAALFTALYIAADSVGSLLIMRVFYGIGFGIASTIIPTLVSQIIPAGRIGEGIGYFGLSTSIAMSIGPMIGLNILKQFGFEALSITGTAAILLIIPILLVFRPLPPEPPRLNQEERKLASASKPPFNFQLVFPALLNILLSITYSGILSFIALYGEKLAINQIGLFFLFNAVTIIIVRPISGKLFDSKGHAAVLIPGALCVIASLTVLSFTTSISLLIVSALLYGLGFGAVQPTIQAWMLRSSSPEQHGAVNSMFYNATDLGVATGAILLGAIASATSYETMYRCAAGVMIIFLLVYLIISLTAAAKNKKRGWSKPEAVSQNISMKNN
ncbi:MFS transporter [Paenibacillus sp. BIHB 4019]|uniref:MFS transporter n=1 Tax=Paenibacillus sp. BIHB 4019 TaxID=1870819 RepID=A0A1B2DP83_9BACL|nr:MFS transporter [Paenibacillus sp. BIHB 4019]ANY69520.1 MFS transporter [Paenibacillus sp. BIHB 4019]